MRTTGAPASTPECAGKRVARRARRGRRAALARAGDEQLAALQALLGAHALTAQEAASHFAGAPPELVRQQLELLAGAGEALRDGEGRYQRVEQPA